MYGLRVHEAVLRAGARGSGCTVHLVDALYDHGPILMQAVVPVLPQDAPGDLAARVLEQEHWLYPEAVRLFVEGRVRVKDGLVEILDSHETATRRVRRALLSASDKTGLVEFARGLERLGVELISTSGTAKALKDSGVEVRPLESLTAFPEILGGRVKTLHPRVHGGILLRREDPAQAREAGLFGIEPIDLVAVNLYPFAKTAAKALSPFADDVIENIDIGGVALIRAAAKNYEDVAVVVSPADYAGVLGELESSSGKLSAATRRRLALAAFEHTSSYDAMIAGAWAGAAGARDVPSGGDPREIGATPSAGEPFPGTLDLRLSKLFDLRYGENPHQKAALYAPRGAGASFEQLHGKELSYNNLLDAFGAWDAACEFQEAAAVVFKHVTPSGIGTAASLSAALERAWACDPKSAFGGVLAFNRPVDAATAAILEKRFVEALCAPGFLPEALELLKKKPNLRLLVMKSPSGNAPLLRSLGAEVLALEPDRILLSGMPRCVSKRPPSAQEETALRFAWAAAKHVRSNAIVLAGPEATVGIGAGQMSRVDSVQVAARKYSEFLLLNPAPGVLALASDAFFPFRDGLDEAAKAGVTAVIEPGGSVRDAEVIAAADEHGMAMLFTGVRHFRH